MTDLPRRLFIASGAAMTLAAARPLAWDFTFPSIEDGTLNLAGFRGRVLLVVNTASFCGFTYQYEQLEKLHASLNAKGLTVVGIPSQDFNQESGSNQEVKQFCEATFGVQFPMAGLTHVRGGQAHPFYKWIKSEKNWEPSWDFHKVLIARDGDIQALFGSGDEPNTGRVAASITEALARTA